MQNSTTDAKPMTRRRKLAFAAVAVLIFCVALEGVAWIADASLGFHQQLLGFLQRMESFNEPIAAQTEYEVPAPGLAVRNDVEDQPPDRSYRVGGRLIPDAYPFRNLKMMRPGDLGWNRGVFVVGESAAYGFPYRFKDTFVALLDKQLSPQGVRAYTASWIGLTSGQLAPVVRRIADEFRPAAVVLFIGNNEWFHWKLPREARMSPSRLAWLRGLAHSRAMAAMEAFWFRRQIALRRSSDGSGSGFEIHHEIEGAAYALAHPLDPGNPHPGPLPKRESEQVFDAAQWPDEKQKYLSVYERNLTDMVRFCRSKGVRVILMTMPFNYKLSPAWIHPQPESFDPTHRAAVQAAIPSAAAAMKAGRLVEALATLDRALALDPLPPVHHYLRGQCLEALGRPAVAEAAYAVCRENMIGHLGSRLSVNEVIRRIGQREGAEVLDVAQLFDEYEHARGKHFNVDLIHDDCHPTPEGHRIIAEGLGKMLEAGK